MGQLLAAFLALSPACSDAPEVVRDAVAAAERHRIPPQVLLAVVMAETRCSYRVGRPRRGCDVGLAQIHIADCRSPEMGRLMQRRPNLFEAARILARSRTVCTGRLSHTRQCSESVWALYNWHSRAWRRKVKRWIARLSPRPAS
jgi:hypothetical protein